MPALFFIQHIPTDSSDTHPARPAKHNRPYCQHFPCKVNPFLAPVRANFGGFYVQNGVLFKAQNDILDKG